jgi:predicted metalloendopeptidase
VPSSIPVRASFAALVLSLAACPGKNRGNLTPPPETVAVSLEEVGLETASMDRTVDPCHDFYQFSCGGWLAANEIPDDKARWARFNEIDEQNEQVLREILEEARAGGDDPLLRKLGDFYGSCMDEDKVEAAGLSGVQPLLDTIGKVKNGETLAAALIALHEVGVGAVFAAGAEGDFADSKVNVMWVDTAGLGLPEREYYFADDFAPKLAAYREHLERLFGLLGKSAKEAKASAGRVLALETKLAEATKSAVERREYAKLYNPHTFDELAAQSPRFDWAAYFAARGTPELAKVIVTTPAFLARFDELIGQATPAEWKDYLTVRLIDGYAYTLPRAYDAEAFALEQALTGIEAQPARWKRCVDAVGAAMSEALAQPFVARRFPGASKQAAIDTVAAISAAFGGAIDELDWMSSETKQAAKHKLGKLSGMIGYPDTWRTYDYPVAPDNFAANAIAGNRAEVRRQFVRAGKPRDKHEWLMPPYIVNAYYSPLSNNTALPAGILQPPFFGARRSIQANLGGIGMVVGHELTHGFDDQGAQFDAEGNMTMWWQPGDFEQFQTRGRCVAEQYSTFEVLPGKKVNGDLTLGENIADLGGIKMAFRAYRAQREGASRRYLADGFTEDQQFFIAVGQAWCSKDRDDEAIKRLTDDPHAPPMWRVNGALRNTPEFAEAFGCQDGSRMKAAPACSVW